MVIVSEKECRESLRNLPLPIFSTKVKNLHNPSSYRNTTNNWRVEFLKHMQKVVKNASP